MKKCLTILLLVVSSAGIFVFPMFAQSSGTVTGVCRKSGVPIEGAIVEWVNLGDGRKYDLTTNVKGEYFSLGIEPGKYRVTLLKDGKELSNLPETFVPPGGKVEMETNLQTLADLYSTAMDLLGKAFLGSDKKAHAVPGTAAAFIAVIQTDPAGPYGAKAREMLTTLGVVWPDWDGQIPAIPKPSTNRTPVYSPPPGK
jgi:hypothetical protein